MAGKGMKKKATGGLYGSTKSVKSGGLILSPAKPLGGKGSKSR